MIEGLARATALALAAGEVEEQHWVLRIGRNQRFQAVRDLGVRARLIQRGEWRPELPAPGLIRVSRCALQREDDRPVLHGSSQPAGTGRSEDESAGRRFHAVTFDLEHRMAAKNEKQLLVSRRIVLVVLVDDDITCRVGAPRGHPKGCYVEVVSDRPIRHRGRTARRQERASTGLGIAGGRVSRRMMCAERHLPAAGGRAAG